MVRRASILDQVEAGVRRADGGALSACGRSGAESAVVSAKVQTGLDRLRGDRGGRVKRCADGG